MGSFRLRTPSRMLSLTHFFLLFILRNTSCRPTINEGHEKHNPSVDHKTVYTKVMKVMKAKFNDGKLSDDQKKNATDIITTTQAMLASYSFAVLGLEKGDLSSSEILGTLASYRDSGNMTEEQSSQITQLAVDTHIKMIQQLAPLLGLNATSLDP